MHEVAMKDQSAFPVTDQDEPIESGLTKREYFAALAMQGVEASNFENEHQLIQGAQRVAQRAVALADALIAELSKDGAI
jgi:hypothetical protein